MGFRVRIDRSGSQKIGKHVEEIKRHYIRAMDRTAIRIGAEMTETAKRKMYEIDYIKSSDAVKSIGSIKKRIKDTWVIFIGGYMSYLPHLEYGTKDHGPKTAKYLKFKIGNQWITTKRVRGIKAGRMIQTAIEKIEKRIPRIFREEVQNPPVIK